MRRCFAPLVALCLLLSLAAPARAGVTVNYKSGGWCDVVVHPDGFAFVREDGRTVIAEVNGAERWRVTLPESILYLRAAAAPNGSILALGQSQSGRALVTIDGRPAQDYGDAFGQNGLVAAFDGARFVLWIQRTATSAARIEVGGAETPLALRQTSQGFRDVTPAGEPLLGDDWFQRTIRGRSIYLPVFRGDLWAGQWSTAGIGVLADDRDVAFTAIPGVGFEPHLARAGDSLAVAARTPNGAALALVTPPYPADAPALGSDSSTSVPTPTPTPTPTPAPAPTTIDIPNYRAELEELRHKYPTPLGDQGGALLNELAWRHRAEGFGLEAKSGGNTCPQPRTGTRVGCDILRYDRDGVHVGMDVLGDTEGAGSVNWGDPGPADANRFVAPAAPLDDATPTSTTPTPAPPTTTPTTPSVDVSGLVGVLLSQLADLRAQLDATRADLAAQAAALQQAVAQLQARPWPSYSARILGQSVTLTPKP